MGVSAKDATSGKITWNIPRAILAEFAVAFDIADVGEYSAPEYPAKIFSWVSIRFQLDEKYIAIENNIVFAVGVRQFVIDGKVKYNQIDEMGAEAHPIIDGIIRDREQKATWIEEDGRVVCWAFDNKTGYHTVGTDPEYRNRGYATKCVERLLLEYDRMGKTLHHSTVIGNAASMALARKCGMREESRGYWIRISKEIGRVFHDTNACLFTS